MGINYNEIESNSVGYKQDYEMFSMDFEEFLWVKGYNKNQIEDMYSYMKDIKPLSNTLMNVTSENFKDYLVLGGMPKIGATFIENKNFSGILNLQKQLINDYEEDITKYAIGLKKLRYLTSIEKFQYF